MKENKYDDDKFFEAYSRMERSANGLAGAGEWHVLRNMLPPLSGARMLDLGCGYGWHCRYAAEHGARYVFGTDISEKMIGVARGINSPPSVEYRVAAIEDLGFADGSFDVVLSSLAFHYLASFETVARNVFRWLRPGGAFVFSVEHPIFTARGDQQWVSDNAGNHIFWPVDRYFDEGLRKADFLGHEVIKFHRTLTTYVNGLLQAGFVIKELVEPQPTVEMLEEVLEMKDELRRPMMLLISAEKPLD